jgi:hypothetical protein
VDENPSAARKSPDFSEVCPKMFYVWVVFSDVQIRCHLRMNCEANALGPLPVNQGAHGPGWPVADFRSSVGQTLGSTRPLGAYLLSNGRLPRRSRRRRWILLILGGSKRGFSPSRTTSESESIMAPRGFPHGVAGHQGGLVARWPGSIVRISESTRKASGSYPAIGR